MGRAVNSDPYLQLGVRPILNAAGHMTDYGGSIPDPRVLTAMHRAAEQFVEIRALQSAVHKRLAELTRNDAAYVTCGATAAIYLATAAAVSEHYGAVIDSVSQDRIQQSIVLVPAGCRSPYDVAVRQCGVQLREVTGGAAQLKRLISPDVVAVLHAPAAWNEPGTPSLKDVASVAHDAGLPLIVDAAAQIPPVANLWAITSAGATVAIFSGGKSLAGPQSTGLLLGREHLIAWIGRIGFPNDGFGRMFKVGRDELVGILTAVEIVLDAEEQTRVEWFEAQVSRFVDALSGHPFLVVSREFPNIAGQPIPFVLVRSKDATVGTAALAAELRAGEPSVVVGPVPGRSDLHDGFIVNPLALRNDDMQTIAAALREVAGTLSRRVAGSPRLGASH